MGAGFTDWMVTNKKIGGVVTTVSHRASRNTVSAISICPVKKQSTA